MEILPAQKRHIPGMLRLLHQVGDVHHQIRPDIFRPGALKYDGAALEALLKDESRPIFIAEEAGQVLGYCFCVHKDTRGSGVLTDRKELYIDDLCVEEACRGQGIAKALFSHATTYARDAGCAFVTLNVWCGNHVAMGFYEKSGLTPRSISMEYKL